MRFSKQVLASLLCALSSNIYFLIGLRVLQSTGQWSSLSSRCRSLPKSFPTRKWGRLLAIGAGANSFGHSVGLNLGGYLIVVYGWRSARPFLCSS